MRAGDTVVARERHRIPQLPVAWVAEGRGLIAAMKPLTHVTDAWLVAVGRDAYRHALAPAQAKTITVIAPAVHSPAKRWAHWGALIKAMPHAVVVGADLPRAAWLRILAMAHTVVCPDTGTAHAADALGCPRVVGLYGAHFTQFAPYWNRAACVVRDGMHRIGVDDVLEAVHG